VQAITKVVVLDDTPRLWAAVWNGLSGNKKEGTPPRRGLKALLLDSAEEAVAPPEMVRSAVVAGAVLEFLSQARPLRDGQEPDSRGIACRLPDGGVVFSFRYMHELLARSADQIKRNELSQLFERCRVVDYRRRVGGKLMRLHVAGSDAIKQLEEEAEG
jgi:hypothetical protein